MEGFFKDYLTYVGESEAPDIFHRWTGISIVASMLGRDVYFPYGHTNIYPNQYILLQGLPASRKSTALGLGTKLLKATKYTRFAPDRMSRQAFINEMHAMNQPESMGLDPMDFLDMNVNQDWPHEMTIHASEFIDFIGQHDKDYLMLLTGLWDNPPDYKNPKVTKTSTTVLQPTVNMLAANTPENLNLAFPAGSMDTGTLSRIIFVHGAPSGKTILIPQGPPKGSQETMVQRLLDIKKTVRGPATLTATAREACEYIYAQSRQKGIADPRFTYYNGRRMTHLWKLILVVMAMRNSTEITDRDVLEANTILAMTEHGMPQALGHFGRSKQSVILHDIVEWIRGSDRPVTMVELYKSFSQDFNGEREFQTCIADLQNSRKLVAINNAEGEFKGFTVKEDSFPKWMLALLMPEVLTTQERATIGV